MVEAARRRAAELGLDDVEFRVVDVTAIDLPESAVDAVLCRFGIMLAPDLGQAFREVARVLKPNGRAVIAVWAEADRNDWMTAAGREALALGLAPRPAPDEPGPFRLADEHELRELADQAGLDVVTLGEVGVSWQAPSLDAWWTAVHDMSRMLATLVESLSPDRVAALRAGSQARLTPYVQGDGSVEVPGAARALLARKPQ
jgi:SAM-dependent methyltransferase